MAATTPDPAQLEQQWLASLEEQYRNGGAYLQNAIPANRAATPEEIAAVLAYLRQLDTWIQQSYGPTAQYLLGTGRPALSTRVAQVRADIEGAAARYMGMYQGAVASRQAIQQAQQQASQQWVQTQQDALARQQQVFDQANRQWTADFTRSCAHCNYYLGDWYYSTGRCPRCGWLLRGSWG